LDASSLPDLRRPDAGRRRGAQWTALTADQILDELDDVASIEHSICVEYLSIHCALGHDQEPADDGAAAEPVARAAHSALVDLAYTAARTLACSSGVPFWATRVAPALAAPAALALGRVVLIKPGLGESAVELGWEVFGDPALEQVGLRLGPALVGRRWHRSVGIRHPVQDQCGARTNAVVRL
jgi:hypothetical protein